MALPVSNVSKFARQRSYTSTLQVIPAIGAVDVEASELVSDASAAAYFLAIARHSNAASTVPYNMYIHVF